MEGKGIKTFRTEQQLPNKEQKKRTKRQQEIFRYVCNASSLSLSGITIRTMDDARVVLEALQQPTTRPTTLYIDHFTLGDLFFAELAPIVVERHSHRISRARFCDGTIGIVGVKAISSIIKDCRLLGGLLFDCSSWCEASHLFVAQALHYLPHLQSLTLRQVHNMTQRAGQTYSTAVAQKVQYLSLQHCDSCDRGVGSFLVGLRENLFLRTLALEDCRLGILSALTLSQVIKDTNSMTKLDLQECVIDSEGGLVVLEALLWNESIQELSLCRLDLAHPRCARTLARVLTTNTYIQSLDIWGQDNNENDDCTIEPIAHALKQNTTLRSFHLCGVKVSDVEAIAFGSALKVNSTLRTLYMEGIAIGNLGGKAIAESLKSNSSLVELGVNGSRMGHIGLRALFSSLRVNQTLKVLQLGGVTYKKLGRFRPAVWKLALQFNVAIECLEYSGARDEDATSFEFYIQISAFLRKAARNVARGR